MAILNTDIKYFKAATNLGGAISATQIATATMNNLIANITSAEALAGVTKYACIYVKNTNSTLLGTTVKAWIFANTPSLSTSVEIGLGGAKNSAETAIVNETTAPTGIVFSAAANEAASIALPNLATNDTQAIWIKYIVTAGSAAIALDNETIRVKMDTPA